MTVMAHDDDDGRYSSTGQLDIIPPLIRKDILLWRRTFRKPVLISEFGADAVAGVHSNPSVAFSEEFQSDYLAAHYPTFDEMRAAQGVFIGEHVSSKSSVRLFSHDDDDDDDEHDAGMMLGRCGTLRTL